MTEGRRYIGRDMNRALSLVRHRFKILFGNLRIKGSQGRILHLIAAGEADTPVKIAAVMNLTRATVTEHLNYLAKLGYVTKIRSENDRRSIGIVLTEEGIKINSRADQILVSFENEIDSIFTDAEKDQISYLMGKIIDFYGKGKTASDIKGRGMEGKEE